MKKIKIGLQSHSVREAFAEDFRGTIRRVAEMGYDGKAADEDGEDLT